MSTVTRPSGERQPDKPEKRGASGIYAAGGTFASALAVVITAAGKAGVNDGTARWAIAAVCVIAALTMFTAARR
jgi:hypothetical protein